MSSPWLIALSVLAVSAVSARAADVVIVESDYLAARQPGEQSGMQRYIKNVTGALNLAGVEWEMSKDSAVENEGALEGYRVAIFPHNGSMPEGEIAAIEGFMDAGGKVILFYSLGGRLAGRIGVEDTGYIGGDEHREKFAVVKFDAPDVVGLPETMTQNSWNIHSFAPAEGGARTIGTWATEAGEDTGPAAVALGEEGAIMNHVLLNGGPEAARFLIAVIGHWFPDVWESAVERALVKSEEFGRFETARELGEFVDGLDETPGVRQMQASIEKAEALRERARELAGEGKWPEALDEIAAIPDVLSENYAKLYPAREGEMRAVWIHSPFNVDDWDVACRRLRECGFNAVILNLCNAAIAYYPSKYLRQHERAKEEGDQILRVLKACRENGIELHVWRVNWNPGGDRERVEQIKADGINAVAADGTPGAWLCSSRPINRQHEIDTMLEIVENYDVDGIHFDYIRYHNSKYCYCDHCRELFEDEIGRPIENWPLDVMEGELREPWLEFRREQINVVVKEVSERAHEMKPWMKVSAAVFGEWAASRISIGQDAKLWVDQGWLDFVCPMDYTNSTDYLRKLTKAQVEAVAGQRPLYIGIGAWRHQSIATLVDQVQSTRELGADGFVLFSYEAGKTREFISLLGEGQTKKQTYHPHHAPQASIALPEGPFEGMHHAYETGERIAAEVELTTQSALPADIDSVQARVVLETTEGKRVRSLGKMSTRQRAKRRVRIKAPEGLTRISVVGTMALEDGTKAPFVHRSALIRGLTVEEVEAIRGANEPPKVEGKGIKVGVTAGGYATASMVEALEGEPGIIPFELNRLTADFLEVCDVVLVAQFRSPADVSREKLQALVEWARNGGRAMLMHDAVGYRHHPPLFPEVGQGREIGEGRQITLTMPNELLAGEGELRFAHSYYDHIRIEAGPDGQVVAREPEEDGGEAVVVAGEFGKGRVVLNGMATGLADGDEEVTPEGGEARVLAAAIRWLAGGVTAP